MSITCCSCSRSMDQKTALSTAAQPIRTLSMSSSTFTSRKRTQQKYLRCARAKNLCSSRSPWTATCGFKRWLTFETKLPPTTSGTMSCSSPHWKRSEKRTSFLHCWCLRSWRTTKICGLASWSHSCWSTWRTNRSASTSTTPDSMRRSPRYTTARMRSPRWSRLQSTSITRKLATSADES